MPFGRTDAAVVDSRLIQVALPLILHGLCSHAAVLGSHNVNIRGSDAGRDFNEQSTSQTYYVTDVATKLAGFATQRAVTSNAVHTAELSRIENAIRAARLVDDKNKLEMAAQLNEKGRLESENAINSMMNLVSTLKQAMGSQNAVASCQLLTCGNHAYCKLMDSGARCFCEDGYTGNGFICNPPAHPVAHLLFHSAAGRNEPRVADLHLAALHGQGLVVAFRDITESHRGYVMFGTAGPTQMDWKAPVLFSNTSAAFGPVFVELQTDAGFAIAYRDANRGGSAFLLGGEYSLDQNRVTFGVPRLFAVHQAQAFAMVALPRSRVALFFVEHLLGHAGNGKQLAASTFGSSLLAEVHTDGRTPELLSKQHFTSGPVARLSVAMLSPESFAVAFRRTVDSPGGEKGEASCTYAQLHDNELLFGAHHLSLEPEQNQIWARSVAPLDDSAFAYTYHSGTEQLTKQAIVKVDRVTRMMSVLQKPKVIGEGFTPYISSMSSAMPDLGNHTNARQRLVTYFSTGGPRPKSQFCNVVTGGMLSGCQDVDWASQEMTSISGAQLGDGRLLFAFTDAQLIGHYQFVGVLNPY
jgi:hypothetical protein